MNSKKSTYIIITVLSALFFLPFLGHYHLFDWDEINFAESAREMIVSQNYTRVQIGFEPFWEKPPLFIWMQVLCMKAFGINEFSARLPNAIFGILTLNILYYLGVKIRNHFTAIFWVMAYATSLAPSLYFRSGIMDPVFNFFIFLSIYHLYKSETGKAEKLNIKFHILLTGLFAGLAVLTKGPVALLIIGLVFLVRIFVNPRHAWMGWINAIIALFTCMAVASIWLLPEFIWHGPKIFTEFIHYQTTLFKGQMEWHNQPWFYHIVVLLFLCFPASVIAIPQLFKGTEYSGEEKIWSQYMRALFWIVLVVFSIATTKIIHYSSLCWMPLGWFAGNAVYKWHTNRGKISNWLKLPGFLVVLVLGGSIALTSLIFSKWINPEYYFPIKDQTFQNILNSQSAWVGWEWLLGVGFVLGGLYWVVASGARKGLHPAWLFFVTALLSTGLSVAVIPSAEKSLQESYVAELQQLSKQDVYIDIWGFKSYAHLFYGQINASQMKGPWEANKTNMSAYPNPNTVARQYWLMDNQVDKPVYIFTRFQYQPDASFKSKFTLQKNLGAYLLWKRNF